MLLQTPWRMIYQGTGKVLTSTGCMEHNRVHTHSMSIPIARFIRAIMPTNHRKPTNPSCTCKSLESLWPAAHVCTWAWAQAWHLWNTCVLSVAIATLGGGSAHAHIAHRTHPARTSLKQPCETAEEASKLARTVTESGLLGTLLCQLLCMSCGVLIC